MIEKMRKYSFLVYHREYEAFLDKLREKGVVHVELTNDKFADNDEIATFIEQDRKVNQVLKNLKKYEAATSDKKLSGEEIMENYDALIEQQEHLTTENEYLAKQIAHLQPLGQFDPALVSKLNENGYYLHLFQCNVKDYSEAWEENYAVFRINQIGTQVYFAIVSDSEKAPDIEIDPLKFPDESLRDVIGKKQKVERHLKDIQKQLSMLGSQTDILQQYEQEVKHQLDFSKVIHGSDRAADDKIAVLEGWVPENQSQALEQWLNDEGIFYDARKPGYEENVPIKLKNNKFNRLFEMIVELYSLPNYGELDLTPFVAFFYWLFFGFCLGDAGYGLLFVVGATIVKKKQKENAKILTIIQLLGVSTIIFGILTGTAFGINLYATNLPVFAVVAKKMNAAGLTIQNLMFAGSLALGVVQILLGMSLNVVKITRQKGFRFAVSKLGWILLIIFSGVNYFLSKEGIVAFGNIYYYIVASAALFVILFLNSPGKNPFINLGVGLWDAYNTAVGGVGDLLSYVRLFALGLATAILGLVFDQLGTMFINPDASLVMQIVGVVLMVFVLLVGHSINIFMSGLGSMVHPLRLTFVEFYKNAGFEGGGIAYKPFKK